MVSLRLHQTVQGSLALCLAHAFAAHAMTALPLHEVTGAGVTVGIVDTDFDPANPEFAGRLTKEVYSPPTAATGAGFLVRRAPVIRMAHRLQKCSEGTTAVLHRGCGCVRLPRAGGLMCT